MNHRDYNSFGSLTSETNAAVDLIFGYTSRPFDEFTWLSNHLNRWLDVWLKQWLSEDPIVFRGQDSNLRRYAGNEPLSSFDPNGLSAWGKAGKLIVETLTKQGVKRSYYQIHHILGRELFRDAKYAKWFTKIGIEQNCQKNLMALPKKVGKENGFMKGAATHTGGPVAEYVTKLQSKADDIMKQHKAGKITDDEAKTKVMEFQDALREGLEKGTIALNREETDILKKGGILSIGGLFFLASAETAMSMEAERAHRAHQAAIDKAIKGSDDFPLTASYWCGKESWVGWGIDLANPADDFKSFVIQMPLEAFRFVPEPRNGDPEQWRGMFSGW